MITRTTAMHSRLDKRKKGFTLTEIAIVLGIIGLILGAIWTAAASVYQNQRTAHANTAVLQIAQGVRTLYSTSTDMGAASTDLTGDLVSAGVIPTDLAIRTTTPPTTSGPFPSGITSVISDNDSNGFLVEMTGVPLASCINLLAQVGGTSRDAGLFQATAVATAAPGTGDAVATNAPLTTAVTPVTAAGASAGGIGGCTNPVSKVQFGFTLK